MLLILGASKTAERRAAKRRCAASVQGASVQDKQAGAAMPRRYGENCHRFVS